MLSRLSFAKGIRQSTTPNAPSATTPPVVVACRPRVLRARINTVNTRNNVGMNQ